MPLFARSAFPMMTRATPARLLGGVALIGAALIAGPMQARAQTQTPKPATPARPAAAAPSAPQQQPSVPADEVLLILIRSTLDALAQANLTNNYSVLHALGSINFQRTTSPEQLQKNFAPLRANGVNLLPLVLLTPQLTAQPAVQNSRLHLTGFYPTRPARVSFDLVFEPSQGQWRMQGINVSLSAAPAAPAPGGTGKPGAPIPQPRPSR